MRLDIRTPIGAMFALLGLALTAYGLFTAGRRDLYDRSIGVNINLWWGLVMLAFGLMMFLLGRRASRRTPPATPDDPATPNRGH